MSTTRYQEQSFKYVPPYSLQESEPVSRVCLDVEKRFWRAQGSLLFLLQHVDIQYVGPRPNKAAEYGI